jgi:flagella basal body P-ring formation protein FlgA
MMAFVLAAAMGCLEVATDRITAGELARAEPAFAALAPETALGYAPAPGARRVLGPSELARWATRYGLALGAARSICVVRAAQRLERRRLWEALQSALGRPEATIELLEWSSFALPPGRLEFPRSGLRPAPAADPTRPVLWHGVLRTAGGRSYPVWARVKITLPCTRLVAAADLPAGRPIAPDQLRPQSFASCLLEEGFAETVEEAAGKIPRRAIRAGAPILRSWLAPPPEVERGQLVEVESVHGSVRLKATARAETSGNTGQRIRVRNVENGRAYQARVTGKGTATVLQGESSWRFETR